MAGNVYNRGDEEDWMLIPHLEDIPQTSYLDMNKVVYFDEDLIGGDLDEITEPSFAELFQGLN